VCVAVYEIPTALELALPEEEIQKYVRSTHYQFRVFDNVVCFMSLHRRYLDKAVTLLFRSTVEFAEFVTSRGLEKSDELGEVTNYANRLIL